jgi:hypothetical protein
VPSSLFWNSLSDIAFVVMSSVAACVRVTKAAVCEHQAALVSLPKSQAV